MKFNIQQEIDEQDIKDLLCCAFEGGSNYWYMIEEFGNPDNIECKYRHIELPLTENGYLMVGVRKDVEEGEKPERLDRKSIQKGMEIMANKYPWHYASFIEENFDAETGDVFLQCCLFGKIVFG